MPTCTVVIKDEVNIKLENLSLEARRALVNAFKYQVPYARHLPSVRLGRWDGKVAYVQLGGSTYINLLPEIIPILEKFNYDIEVDDRRTYSTKFDFDTVHANTFSQYKWPKGHVSEGQPITLRDYQIEVINNFLNNPQCIQEVATGAGKTIITAALSHSVQKYGRTVVIVPNKDLVTQTEADYQLIGLDVGVYFGERKEYGHQHTICTWQSLNNLLKNSRNAAADVSITEFLEDVVCIMVDEVHMAKAEVLKSMLTSVMAGVPIRWGLTGTVPKELFESQALLVSLGPVINKLAASELQERGVLAQCHVNVVQLVDHMEFRDYQSELKYLTTTDKRIEAIAKLVNKIKDGGNTLILVDRIECGRLLQQHLDSIFSSLKDKPDVVFISGNTKSADRKEEYRDVATSTNKIIIATYGVAAVGINIPRIFNLVLFEAGKSFVRVIQSIGRGIRKAEDKDFVQIWDITSTCKFAKRHLAKRKQYYKEAQYEFAQEKLDWSLTV